MYESGDMTMYDAQCTNQRWTIPHRLDQTDHLVVPRLDIARKCAKCPSQPCKGRQDRPARQ